MKDNLGNYLRTCQSSASMSIDCLMGSPQFSRKCFFFHMRPSLTKLTISQYSSRLFCSGVPCPKFSKVNALVLFLYKATKVQSIDKKMVPSE